MAFRDELTALEQALEQAQIPVEAVQTRAGVHRTTWTRWQKGSTKPRYETWADVTSAARAIISERASVHAPNLEGRA
jgi:hypothetical protein